MAMKMINLVIIACALLFLVESQGNGAMAGTVGINWGRMNAQKLVPSMVVDLLLQNNISAARVYTAQDDILEAFSGSGIHLTVGIFRPHYIKSVEDAIEWVENREKYLTLSNIRRVVMGSSAIQAGGSKNNSNMMGTLQAIGYIQEALNQKQLGDKTKATVELTHTVFITKFTKPSEAAFHEDVKDDIIQAVSVLRLNKAPLLIEMFPISFVTETVALNPEFAYMDGRSNVRVADVNGVVYTNVVEFILDSYIWALEKIGAGDIELVLSTVGWPTDGYPGATAANAERFYKSFLPWVVGNKGTPKRPGYNWSIYINSLADENLMPYRYPFSRHWGIYTSYGDAKYKIDLSGQGRDTYPTKAKGIMRMPKRWCILDETKLKNKGLVDHYFKKACNYSDCTSLAPGGSCSQLSYDQNISYAFNMFFQLKFQREIACSYLQVAKVVTTNPSVGNCVFPVEVVKPRDGDKKPSNGGVTQNHVPKYVEFSMLFISLFWLLVWN